MDLGTPDLLTDRPAPGVLRVTLNRPDHMNACTGDMYRGLRLAVQAADDDPALRALVLTGKDPAFCTGGDLKRGAEMRPADTPDAKEALAARLRDTLPFDDLERSQIPVIAAVNGPAMGGGLIMTLLADVVVASERATFRAPELHRGISDAWVTTRLPAIVGLARARWMLLTAATVDAQQAERIGLVARVVPHHELEAASLEVAAAVARAAPGALRAARRALGHSLPLPDMPGFLDTLSSDEAIEGMRAFAERRDPGWVP